MTEDELARPLTAEEEAEVRRWVFERADVSPIPADGHYTLLARLLATLDALRALPVADTAGIDAERLREAVEAAYPFMSCVPPRLLAPLRAAALRTPKPEGEPE